MLPRSQRFRVLLALLVVLAIGTACIPTFGTQAGPLTHGVLTPDRSDTYLFETRGATTTFRAPSTNKGGNLREFYWDTTSPFNHDQESCNRWDTVMDASSPESLGALTRKDVWQPGVGLRIAPTEDGTGLRGISVDLNIWAVGWWAVKVLGWDSSDTAHPYSGLATFDISPIVGPAGGLLAPPPWNLCGQVFGNTLRMKFWIGNNPEPSWNDPTHVFTTVLPPEWNFAGYPGGYVAHIAPGATQRITMLRTGVLMPDGSRPPPSTTPSAPDSTSLVVPSTSTSSLPVSTTTLGPTTIVPVTSTPVSTSAAPSTVPAS